MSALVLYALAGTGFLASASHLLVDGGTVQVQLSNVNATTALRTVADDKLPEARTVGARPAAPAPEGESDSQTLTDEPAVREPRSKSPATSEATNTAEEDATVESEVALSESEERSTTTVDED